MRIIKTEYQIFMHEHKSYIFIRKQNRDLSHYFHDSISPDPLNQEVLIRLIMKTEKVMGVKIHIYRKEIEKDIIFETESKEIKILESFAETFLSELEKFYEEHEAHVTRMFGSFIYLKRVKGELKAIKATPVPIQYCPLMKKLLIEVGGKEAVYYYLPSTKIRIRSRK